MNMTESAILLAEDNPDDVALIERAFIKAKLQTPLQVVPDGDAAVAYLSGAGPYSDRAQFPLPTLLLLDLKLPRRSGFDVLSWVRDHPALRRLPVVVLTSSREGVDINRAYELGANSYLTKPVRFENLLEMMRTLDAYWLRMNEKPAVQDGLHGGE